MLRSAMKGTPHVIQIVSDCWLDHYLELEPIPIYRNLSLEKSNCTVILELLSQNTTVKYMILRRLDALIVWIAEFAKILIGCSGCVACRK